MDLVERELDLGEGGREGGGSRNEGGRERERELYLAVENELDLVEEIELDLVEEDRELDLVEKGME